MFVAATTVGALAIDTAVGATAAVVVALAAAIPALAVVVAAAAAAAVAGAGVGTAAAAVFSAYYAVVTLISLGLPGGHSAVALALAVVAFLIAVPALDALPLSSGQS